MHHLIVANPYIPQFYGGHNSNIKPDGKGGRGLNCHVFTGKIGIPNEQIHGQAMIDKFLGKGQSAAGETTAKMAQVEIRALDH
jgi:hypothetical protein